MSEAHDSSETHDFDDTVVAVVARGQVDEIVASLTAAGYEHEVISGAEGKEHLDPSGEQSTGSAIKRLLNAFGDQYRVVERLHDELDAGNVVISVDSKPDDASEAVRVLQDHDGEFIWKLGTWTFTRVGE